MSIAVAPQVLSAEPFEPPWRAAGPGALRTPPTRENGPVLILLPPSEGKAPGGAGPVLDLKALAFPELAPTRKAVLRALTKVSKCKAATALDVLGLSPNQGD